MGKARGEEEADPQPAAKEDAELTPDEAGQPDPIGARGGCGEEVPSRIGRTDLQKLGHLDRSVDRR